MMIKNVKYGNNIYNKEAVISAVCQLENGINVVY